jgi:hypothetical protein
MQILLLLPVLTRCICLCIYPFAFLLFVFVFFVFIFVFFFFLFQEEQLALKPWEGMDEAAMKGVIDEVMAVLEPLIETAQREAAAAEEEGKEAKP